MNCLRGMSDMPEIVMDKHLIHIWNDRQHGWLTVIPNEEASKD